MKGNRKEVIFVTTFIIQHTGPTRFCIIRAIAPLVRNSVGIFICDLFHAFNLIPLIGGIGVIVEFYIRLCLGGLMGDCVNIFSTDGASAVVGIV